mgnify:CR=1 FL=1
MKVLVHPKSAEELIVLKDTNLFTITNLTSFEKFKFNYILEYYKDYVDEDDEDDDTLENCNILFNCEDLNNFIEAVYDVHDADDGKDVVFDIMYRSLSLAVTDK